MYNRNHNPVRHREYKEMMARKQTHVKLPQSNDTPFANEYIRAHLPKPWCDKTIHHVGISSNDACTMVVVFTDGTQTNLNF